MKKFKVLLIVFIISFLTAKAQDGIVGKHIQFAGMTLHLNNHARGLIQAEVNKIRKSEKHFQMMVDKANIHFQLIEDVFRQENFPDDIKYLIIQETGFQAEAVSSSNAVGYWQFKEGTATEVGLRVDGTIDERKNLVAASRGAARYMSKTNLKVNNWVYALLSYNVGPGGVMSHIKDKYVGAKDMNIDGHIHWYVIKFLAHKVAYEGAIKTREPNLYLTYRDDFTNENLKHIAKNENIDLELLSQYNRWISAGKKIPDDKPYSVVLPSTEKRLGAYVASAPSIKVEKDKTKVYDNQPEEKPKKGDVVERYDAPQENIRYKVNNVAAIVAVKGDNSHNLALLGDITKKKFINYNEIASFTQLLPGVTYFVGRKKNSARVNFHTVKKEETLWDISQQYAIKTKAIRRKNRLTKHEEPEEGRVLWLRSRRPVDAPITYRKPKETIKQEKIVVTKKENLPPKEVNQPKQEEVAQTVSKEAKREPETDTQNTNYILHTISLGETLYSISKKYNVTVDQIKEENQLISDALTLGAILKIKSTEITQPSQNTISETYTVQQGDTFYSIAKKFNVSIQELLKRNNKTAPELKIGEQLIIR